MSRILVIDDEPLAIGSLTEMLSYEGHEVLKAETGEQGLELARHDRPDLVICDLMMPELNGLDVLRAFQADVGTADIPFLFLSTPDDQEIMRQSMSPGAVHYLIKPFALREALAAINLCLPPPAGTDNKSITLTTLAARYCEAILHGQHETAHRLVTEGVNNGLTLADLYLHVFQPALYEVGDLWEEGQISVTQEHLATAITQSSLSKIYGLLPLPIACDKRAIIACLSGNYHEIGARMVADFMQLAGYETRFMGANTAEEDFLAAVDEARPDVIGLTASLDVHVPRIQEIIHILRTQFENYRPLIMVGGSAFNRDHGLWERVGADVWGPDAQQALANLAMKEGGT